MLENMLFDVVFPREGLLTRLSKHPTTAFMLLLIVVLSFLYGLCTIQDRAFIFSTGSFHPIFFTLWTTEMSDVIGAISDFQLWFFAPNFLLQIAGFAIRLGIVNAIVISSGELLMVVSAFRFFVMPVEGIVGTRSCVKLLVAAYIARVLWLLVMVLAEVTSYRVVALPATWRGIVEKIMTLRPGPSWLCVAFYFWNETLLWMRRSTSAESLTSTVEEHSRWDDGSPFFTREFGQREGREPVQQTEEYEEEQQRSIAYPSCVRLFNKIPLGPETLRAVVVTHLFLSIAWGEVALALCMGLMGSLWIYRRSGIF
ncbi:unnamed protein product [Phytomonas sp. EM1]|nr:unnamed protein product [Phytomonas sp. EM1]|eukprot:CCW61660.1 unnamed protein product [Phytomonas sp. isolate EM1]